MGNGVAAHEAKMEQLDGPGGKHLSSMSMALEVSEGLRSRGTLMLGLIGLASTPWPPLRRKSQAMDLEEAPAIKESS